MNQGIISLANYLRSKDINIRLEAEGKRERLLTFFEEYRNITGENLTFDTDGIVLLQEDADKWGLELRIYISDITNFPREYATFLTSNTRYEQKYGPYVARFNNNDVIMLLIKCRLRIGDA